jgi:hypothetical protein
MPYEHLLDSVPVWVFFVLIMLTALVPIEIGQRFGARRRRNSNHEPEGPVGNVVGATLALLGFMVALTVGAATARIDARKEALIDGVNSIGTAFRYASLLTEPHKSECRQQLREYVEVLAEMPNLYSDHKELQKLETRTRALEQVLWSHAEALATIDRSSEIYALFTASINEVIQSHTKRVVIGAQHRIPMLVWGVLMIVTIITMFGVGFSLGFPAAEA